VVVPCLGEKRLLFGSAPISGGGRLKWDVPFGFAVIHQPPVLQTGPQQGMRMRQNLLLRRGVEVMPYLRCRSHSRRSFSSECQVFLSVAPTGRVTSGRVYRLSRDRGHTTVASRPPPSLNR
ncbi:MAG: hypothetical protein M5U34_39615, partial [Chloroflexi bacterium]|nr:hypothetical protein [Chloroflexota bacterium]